MKNKNLNLLIATLAVSLSPLALYAQTSAPSAGGHETGNGTDVVVCPPGVWEREVELLEFYELRRTRGAFMPDMSRAFDEKRALELIRRLDTLFFEMENASKPISDDLIKRVQPLLNAAKGITDEQVGWHRDPGPLLGRNTVGQSGLPHVSCSLWRLVNQIVPSVIGDQQFTVHKELWEKLSADEKEAAIAHEAIYAQGMSVDPNQDSVLARQLTQMAVMNKVMASPSPQIMRTTLGRLSLFKREFFNRGGYFKYFGWGYRDRNGISVSPRVNSSVVQPGSMIPIKDMTPLKVDSDSAIEAFDSSGNVKSVSYLGSADPKYLSALHPELVRCGLDAVYRNAKEIFAPRLHLAQSAPKVEFMIDGFQIPGEGILHTLPSGQKMYMKGSYRESGYVVPRSLRYSFNHESGKIEIKTYFGTIHLTEAGGPTDKSVEILEIDSDCRATKKGTTRK